MSDDDLIRRGDAKAACQTVADEAKSYRIPQMTMGANTCRDAINDLPAVTLTPTAVDASQPADPATYNRGYEDCLYQRGDAPDPAAIREAALKPLLDLVEEFVTVTWHLLDNSETSGPVDDPTITVWKPDFDLVSELLDRCEALPSGSTEHMTAGELLVANILALLAKGAAE